MRRTNDVHLHTGDLAWDGVGEVGAAVEGGWLVLVATLTCCFCNGDLMVIAMLVLIEKAKVIVVAEEYGCDMYM